MIQIKDEYKTENEQLRMKNENLRTENEFLKSNRTAEKTTAIAVLNQTIDKLKNEAESAAKSLE